MVEKLVLDPFLKNQNQTSGSVKFYTVCFYCMENWEFAKHVETKLHIICYYLMESFFKK